MNTINQENYKNSPVNIPILTSPVGSTDDVQPNFEWKDEMDSPKYQIQIFVGDEIIFDRIIDRGKNCSDSGCMLVPDTAFKGGNYKWRVRSYSNLVWNDFGDFQDFSIVTEETELNTLSDNLEDCISSWWMFPLAKRFINQEDQTYIGYTDSNGFSGIISINNSTGEIIKKRLIKREQPDDHNAVAIVVLDNRKIMVAYTAHNTEAEIHIQISSKPENIENFETGTIIKTSQPVSYVQLFKVNNRFWLFFRSGTKSWSYISSTDGIQWTEPVKIIQADMQYYLEVVEITDSDLLRLIMYSHPNEKDPNIRMGFFDTASSQIKLSDGTILGTSNIDNNLFPVIVPVEDNKKYRLLDVAKTGLDTTIIAFSEFSNAYDSKYKIAYVNAGTLSVIPIVDAGNPFYTASIYVGGMVFGYDPNTVYLSREEDGNWYIEEWKTLDQGSFSLSKLIYQSDNNNVAIRPILEEDGDKLIWQEGYYNPKSYSDFYTNYDYAVIRILR